ncbi:sugar dehydrogenase complex small subunit [uncultured Shewanella sp.]|uniref:sugar dehydrogenase complex small subunit n=1 Tax=uncultured Shewanella sp. TaxID=173975 RepID=UPI002632ED1F|nr:sugar dehydrogenase complex small subunit [uncultured Shewanella sp.]
MDQASFNIRFLSHPMTRRQLLKSVASIGALTLASPSPLEAVTSSLLGSLSPNYLFLTVSERLTETKGLMPVLSTRFYHALKAEYPFFDITLRALATECETANEGALASQLSSSSAVTAKQILCAWYTGMVGKGTHAQVITYRHGLGFNAVDDVLGVRSYCPNKPGFWAIEPRERTP